MSLALSLNPGFPLLLGALLALLAPQAARGAISALATLAGLLLLFVQDFGQSAALSQLGLSLVPMRMDALAQTFGLAFLLVTALLALHGADGRSKTEEAALLAQSGGAVAALFAGDLVSFIAAAEVAAFAGAALLLARTEAGARKAGLAMLGWQAFGAIALLSGAAAAISAGDAPIMARMSLMEPAGAAVAVGLWVKAAGPGAHFWLKNAAPRTSAAGTAALVAFTLTLALYAGIRLFEGSDALVAFGAASCALAALYGAIERQPMRGAAHAMIAQLGLGWIAVGLGAGAGAAAHAFCALLAVTALVFALGEARDRISPEDENAERPARPILRALPFSAAAAAVAGLSLAGLPLLAGARGLALVFEAARPLGPGPLILLTGAAGVAAAHGAFKLAWLGFVVRRRARVVPGLLSGAQYAMIAALALIAGVGLQPNWLYEFLPPAAAAPSPPGQALPLLGQSLCVAVALVVAGLLLGRVRAPRRTIALDAAAGAAAGEALSGLGRSILRAHALWRRAETALAATLAARLARALTALDRPSGPVRRETLWLLAAMSAVALVAVTQRLAQHP